MCIDKSKKSTNMASRIKSFIFSQSKPQIQELHLNTLANRATLGDVTAVDVGIQTYTLCTVVGIRSEFHFLEKVESSGVSSLSQRDWTISEKWEDQEL